MREGGGQISASQESKGRETDKELRLVGIHRLKLHCLGCGRPCGPDGEWRWGLHRADISSGRDTQSWGTGPWHRALQSSWSFLNTISQKQQVQDAAKYSGNWEPGQAKVQWRREWKGRGFEQPHPQPECLMVNLKCFCLVYLLLIKRKNPYNVMWYSLFVCF